MRIRKESIVLALVVTILGMTTMSSLFSLLVKAEFNPVITISTEGTSDVQGVQEWVKNVNSELATTDLDSDVKNQWTQTSGISDFRYLEVSGNKEVTVTIRKFGSKTRSGQYEPGYNDIDTSSRNRVIEIALSYLDENKNMSRVTKTKLYNFIYNSDETTASMVKQLSSDTRGDFYSAYATLRDFKIFKFISKLLGIISLLIFMLLAITLSLDLAYLNIPAIQWFFDKNSLGKSNDNLSTRLISFEARQAKENSERSSSGNSMSGSASPTGVYLRSKTKQMAALFICLLYLVSGQIYTLMASFMDLFRQAFGL